MASILISVIVGFCIGIFSGLLGIGGGTLLVPTLRLGFGLSAIQSTATSLFAIVPTSIAGAITHIKNKTCIPAIGLICGISGAFSSPLGVYLASISPGLALMIVAGIIIVYSAVNMLRKALAMSPAKLTAVVDTVSTDNMLLELSKSNVFRAMLIGLLAGFFSGYVGVGGGFIMVPLFVTLLNVNMKKASGTSLIAVCILSIPGVVEQALLGNISYIAGISLALGCIPGAIVGARLIKSIPEKTLRFTFAGFLLIAAIALLVNEFLA